MYVHTTCLNLSEALSECELPTYTPDCARFARLVWGYWKVNLSEAVRYPFSAWCLTRIFYLAFGV